MEAHRLELRGERSVMQDAKDVPIGRWVCVTSAVGHLENYDMTQTTEAREAKTALREAAITTTAVIPVKSSTSILAVLNSATRRIKQNKAYDTHRRKLDQHPGYRQ